MMSSANIFAALFGPFWNGRDLERKLAEFQRYYNAARSHASLDGHTPLSRADTDQGVRSVETLLGRIGHGIAA